MGFLQNFIIGFLVFSLFITMFTVWQSDVFTNAAPMINVTFDNEDRQNSYSALGNLTSDITGYHADTFNTENATSEDVQFEEVGMIESTRNIFDVVLKSPKSAHRVITNIANDLGINNTFVNAAYAIILATLFFTIGGLLFRKRI